MESSPDSPFSSARSRLRARNNIVPISTRVDREKLNVFIDSLLSRAAYGDVSKTSAIIARTDADLAENYKSWSDHEIALFLSQSLDYGEINFLLQHVKFKGLQFFSGDNLINSEPLFLFEDRRSGENIFALPGTHFLSIDPIEDAAFVVDGHFLSSLPSELVDFFTDQKIIGPDATVASIRGTGHSAGGPIARDIGFYLARDHDLLLTLGALFNAPGSDVGLTKDQLFAFTDPFLQHYPELDDQPFVYYTLSNGPEFTAAFQQVYRTGYEVFITDDGNYGDTEL